jgi:hypothetical protein
MWYCIAWRVAYEMIPKGERVDIILRVRVLEIPNNTLHSKLIAA